MSKAVRFTKKELTWLIALIDATPVGLAVRSTARDKLALAELSIRSPEAATISIKEAVAAMERVLGPKAMAVPDSAPPLFYIKLQARIRALGLTADNFRTMAVGLQRRGWRPPYSLEKTVWQADRWMAEGAEEYAGPVAKAFNNGPRTLDEL